MRAKRQVVVIHGGDFFDSREQFFASLKEEALDREDLFPDETKGWKDNLQADLGDGFEVMRPKMPLKEDAKYEEWELWFEKMFPFFEDGIILVGHSLGGIFLARYLAEHAFPKKIGAVFFIAAPYFAASKGSVGENGGFVLTSTLSRLAEQANRLVFYYSEDDEIVSAAHAKKFKKELPNAEYVIFKDKGHFFAQEYFPELVTAIKGLDL